MATLANILPQPKNLFPKIEEEEEEPAHHVRHREYSSSLSAPSPSVANLSSPLIASPFSSKAPVAAAPKRGPPPYGNFSTALINFLIAYFCS